jgi:uncharacterized protein YjbI with pentapeptide repeats
MEVLTAYVRVHAPLEEADENAPAAHPEPDIQAILTVVGRRNRTFETEKSQILDLRDVNLEGARLVEANLSGANLRGANLRSAQLNDVSLRGTDLTCANLTSVDLREARNLTQQQIDSAKGNKDTKLPPGLVMPDSWKNNP